MSSILLLPPREQLCNRSCSNKTHTPLSPFVIFPVSSLPLVKFVDDDANQGFWVFADIQSYSWPSKRFRVALSRVYASSSAPQCACSVCVCVFITAGPSTKLFAWGGGGIWTTCATRDDEPRPVREGACIGAATMLQPWILRLILNAAALAAASPTLLFRPW
jgi:hypothetical protein